MAEYAGYHRNDCIPDRMNPVDLDRFTKALPHATKRLPDWEFFLSYFGESKVVFAKPLGEPDSTGNMECETITIPFR